MQGSLNRNSTKYTQTPPLPLTKIHDFQKNASLHQIKIGLPSSSTRPDSSILSHFFDATASSSSRFLLPILSFPCRPSLFGPSHTGTLCGPESALLPHTQRSQHLYDTLDKPTVRDARYGGATTRDTIYSTRHNLQHETRPIGVMPRVLKQKAAVGEVFYWRGYEID